MKTVQVNLKMPEKLYKAANQYADKYGYRNIQELAADSIREKVLDDEDDLTPKEIELVEKLVQKSLEEGNLVSEKELRRLLKT
ncbi:hypothetical protein HY572_03110 [Candidatus Micrarchaeota archaeon]|nr:hypothetical protein [Candidatus Micrarchaeota archaeon]